MDPYSHAYPSSHRRSTSKIGIPKKPRSALESVQSEPFVLLVASAVVSSCALIAVDAWALKRGMHAVVLTAASMLCGAAWGAARGHLRLELLPTAVADMFWYSFLQGAQQLALFTALASMPLLRVLAFTCASSAWSVAATRPLSSIKGCILLLLAAVLSVYLSAKGTASHTSIGVSHAAIGVHMICASLKVSPKARLEAQFSSDGQEMGLNITRTLSMALASILLAPLIVIGSLTKSFSPSLACFDSLSSLQYSVYALILAQVIIAPPTLFTVPMAVSGPSLCSTYPISLAITALLSSTFWRAWSDITDLSICVISGLAIYCLPKISFNQAASSLNSSALTSAAATSSSRRLLRTYLKTILDNPESRKIYYFLLLNLGYMLVQMVWGVWTNSLGLISDAIHMFFDCMALGVGLFASVMATWKPNEGFTYGYGRVETLSGFANGIFLILISVFIVFEAVQRIADPPEMNTNQLLLVSSVGLAINLFGMVATGGHAHHGHSHGGHAHAAPRAPSPPPSIKSTTMPSHSHSHAHSHSSHQDEPSDHHGHSHAAEPSQSTLETLDQEGHHDCDGHDHGDGSHTGHDHSSHEGHSHNMRGVFLHVLADVLGSVGVIISTLLINYTGWTGWDPIASLAIAGLIFASVLPLVIDTGKLLCLHVDKTRETQIRKALADVSAIDGVAGYGAPRFWSEDEGKIIGSIHIHINQASSSSALLHPTSANVRRVVEKVDRVLKSQIGGLKELVVQVEGDSGRFCSCLTG